MTVVTESPERVVQAVSQHLNTGDLEGMLALYEPQAAFVPEPGATVSGTEAIRGALAQFLALKPTIEGEVQKVVQADDTALVVYRWSLKGTAPDGESVAMKGTSTDIVRRQPDGRWLVLIDDPFGTE